MPKYPFLSDDWFTQVAELVVVHGGNAPANQNVKVNLIVTETPFEIDVQFHMGAADGQSMFGAGHIDPADVTLTTDYITAKDVFVSGNPQAGMQAFMAGRVKVQGDMTKLMMAQQGGGPAGSAELQKAIEEVTE